ncbi:MAG TPA: 6-phosphogluconolactonase [Terriglobales bacterium]|nr:6-phosphogluconolactonase [Terriglobales bacterium]
MQIEVLADADKVAARAAAVIAMHARAAFESRGRFLMAVSGGYTPCVMLRMLATEEVPWGGVHVLQVEERIAPGGDPARNLTYLRETLLENAPIDSRQIYAMPVEDRDPQGAAAEYARRLERIVGSPPIIDLVHLALGLDGHTASLVPGDPVLQVTDRDVAVTGLYQGHKRMTLTYPVINRARQILWVVTGSEKGRALFQLQNADPSIPGGWVRRDQSLVLADEAASGAMHVKMVV